MIGRAVFVLVWFCQNMLLKTLGYFKIILCVLLSINVLWELKPKVCRPVFISEL